MTDAIFIPGRTEGASEAVLGGKAWNLLRLQQFGFPVPRWIALTDAAFDADRNCVVPDLAARLAEAGLTGKRFAVRSSAAGEDGANHSFAGQLETFLSVPPGGVAEAAEKVRRSAFAPRVAAYCKEHGIAALGSASVIVQEMVDAVSAGVAFGCDMETGSRRGVSISAVFGLGEGLVSGQLDADNYYVQADGHIRSRIADKREMLVDSDGETRRTLTPEAGRAAVLSEARIRELAAVVRAISDRFGRIQDVEWAFGRDGALRILQARPVTTLANLPDPDGVEILWDNSNIVESYPGVTTPLTFSFIRGVYSEVYKRFCDMMGVEPSMIADNADAFEMLGLIRGRVYYNLRNWYKVLMLLPGYDLNAPFMERMMGVKEPLRDKPSIRPSRRNPRLRLVSTVCIMLKNLFTLEKQIRAFTDHFGRVVGPMEQRDFGQAGFEELTQAYRTLETEFLPAWQPPLINDFFAMFFYGMLGKLQSRWLPDADGALSSNLLAGEGGIISAEPVMRLRKLAEAVARDPEVKAALEHSDADFLRVLETHPGLGADYRSYLEKFGDRCVGELKLETVTYREDPSMLLDILRSYVKSAENAAAAPDEKRLRADAEAQVRIALRRHPLRRMIFFFVLRRARRMVRNRENLRFERTRLFAQVRRIFLGFGRRLSMEGALDSPRDVFYLEKEEILAWAAGTAVTSDLRALATLRKKEFDGYRSMPAPAERFTTHGAVPAGNDFTSAPDARPAESAEPAELKDSAILHGIPCCGKKVRGIARVVTDPTCTEDLTGNILVALRTDPGWAPLFPVCKGVLVERGSILSHAAILTRELGIPCIVGIAGLTARIHDGELIEMDPASGTVLCVEDRP